jgi:hypothetical protein
VGKPFATNDLQDEERLRAANFITEEDHRRRPRRRYQRRQTPQFAQHDGLGFGVTVLLVTGIVFDWSPRSEPAASSIRSPNSAPIPAAPQFQD